ncbi:hypothetical protein C0416_01930 [bacterium]|nr:hypothetical protein [bacterium]
MVLSEILKALESGNLDKGFVEKHLAEILRAARNVNAFTNNGENAIGQDLKTRLLVKLATSDLSRNNLKKILEKFCAENGLDLHPKAGWVLTGIETCKLNPDLISDDNKIAIKINKDNICVYEKLNNGWVGMVF